jgi:hypothetical protein
MGNVDYGSREIEKAHHDANERCAGGTVIEPTDFAEGDGESKEKEVWSRFNP